MAVYVITLKQSVPQIVEDMSVLGLPMAYGLVLSALISKAIGKTSLQHTNPIAEKLSQTGGFKKTKTRC
jgi:hypothetical protein